MTDMNVTAMTPVVPRKPRLAADPAEELSPGARALGPDVFLSLFVACYNESGNITGTLETVVAAASRTVPSYEIVVVDDGSRDSSVQEIRSFMSANPELPIRLLINPRNEGVANNYAEAAFRSRGEWYRMICGDNVESEETLATIFAAIGEAELLIPYYVEHPGRAWHRRVISSCYTWLVNLLSGYRIHYYNGMPLTRRYYAMRWHSNSHGFGFQADLVTRLLALGATYKEVGVIGRERAGGRSTALNLRNFCSVAHSLQNILIRRISKTVYGHC
jgi:glycosyltransferase involved in cell wall biosynthesis